MSAVLNADAGNLFLFSCSAMMLVFSYKGQSMTPTYWDAAFQWSEKKNGSYLNSIRSYTPAEIAQSFTFHLSLHTRLHTTIYTLWSSVPLKALYSLTIVKGLYESKEYNSGSGDGFWVKDVE